MAALSSADKLRLKVSRERVERWERERRKPAVNFVRQVSGKLKPIARCNLVWAMGQQKPLEVIKRCKLEWE